MTVAKIIEMCGGARAIVFELDLANKDVVNKWKKRGIPLRNWKPLIQLAKANGHRLTGDSLWTAVEHLITKESE